MRPHFAHVAALLCVSGSGPASVSAQLTEAELSGCYDVAEGEWTEGRVAGLMFSGGEILTDTSVVQEEPVPSELGLDSAFSQIPPRVRFAGPPADPTLGSAGRIIVPEGALPTPHAYMGYRVRSDTLRLSFSTGFHGVSADLGLDETGAWTGTANTFSDNVPYRSWTRPVRVTPVACDSPPPVPSSAMRPAPRSVELVGGATIALGEPLPGSLETLLRRSGALTVIGRTEGLFGTTDSIAVRVDDMQGGRIGRIQLIYLDADMSSVIEARLTEAFGNPVGGNAFYQWRNRVTWVWLRRGTRFTVNLSDRRYR